MRLLLITSTFPFGSGESFLRPEISALVAAGHDVKVVPVRPRERHVHSSLTEIHAATCRRDLLSASVFAGAAAELVHSPRARVPRIIDVKRPVVSLKNAAALPKSLWVASSARRWRAEHLHAYWGYTPSTAAWVASVSTHIPWSFTVHSWDISENNMLREKLAHSQFVRCVSETGRRQLGAYEGESRARVLHLGVDTDVIARPYPAKSGSFRLLVPASLIPVKGHTHLLTALAQLRLNGLTLDIAGEGPLRADLERQVRHQQLTKNVRFLGILPNAVLLARLSSGEWDAVVMPSIDRASEREGIPVALMEAMARAVPVIATASGATPELVTNNVGRLVAPGSANELADAIAELCTDPVLRETLGRNGRAVVRKSFDARASAATLLSWISP